MAATVRKYETDLTDEEWVYIDPFVRAEQGQYGPKIRVSRREVVNAIRYVLRTGCQWRLIPNRSTVRHYYDICCWGGIWERLNAALIRRVRLRRGKEPTPSEMGGEVGFDGGKKHQGQEARVRG